MRTGVLLCLLLAAGAAQTERWVYRYGAPQNGGGAYSLVNGADGNLYAAGSGWENGDPDDFTVVSLTTAGVVRWVYRYDGPGSGEDRAYSIASGPDSNVYAAGYCTGSDGCQDFTIISLAPNGGERWLYRYAGPPISDDCAYSVVCGADGNIYAAGTSGDSAASLDFTVISLTPDGNERWTYRHNGSRNSWDEARSVVYGDDGNIYAAGWTEGSSTFGDFTVISLATNGDERWVYAYNGPGNYNDKAYSVVFGPDGILYAAGTSCDSNIIGDFTVIGLTQAGGERWVYLHDGPAEAFSIAPDADGNLYAAGQSEGTADDFTVISLTPGGNERWVYRYNAPTNGDDQAYSVIVGGDGHVYGAGWGYAGPGTYWNLTVVKLTSHGEERWVYVRPSRGVAKAIVHGADGNVYTAGWNQGSGPYDDLTVISLDPAAGVVESVSPALRREAPTSMLRRLPADTVVFDAMGRRVLHPKPGIYFLRTAAAAAPRKVLLVE